MSMLLVSVNSLQNVIRDSFKEIISVYLCNGIIAFTQQLNCS